MRSGLTHVHLSFCSWPFNNCPILLFLYNDKCEVWKKKRFSSFDISLIIWYYQMTEFCRWWCFKTRTEHKPLHKDIITRASWGPVFLQPRQTLPRRFAAPCLLPCRNPLESIDFIQYEPLGTFLVGAIVSKKTRFLLLIYLIHILHCA